MSEPFLAEIRMVGFTFAPRGWALCDGQILPISQNQALFALMGTTYGGDGRTTFALPDLRGRTPIHVGSSGGAAHAWASRGGEESHTLAVAELPAHSHPLKGSAATASSPTPGGNAHAVAPGSVGNVYSGATSAPDTQLAAGAVAAAGGGQGHDNMMPYLVLNFCIALQGLFPSRN